MSPAELSPAEFEAAFKATMSLFDARTSSLTRGSEYEALRNIDLAEISTISGVSEERLRFHCNSAIGIVRIWLSDRSQAHTEHLWQLFNDQSDTFEGLRDVLLAHAVVLSGMNDARGEAMSSWFPRPSRIADANPHLHGTMGGILARASKAGVVRNDVAAGELASYALSALEAASNLPATDAVRRIVDLTLETLTSRTANKS